MPRGRRRYAQPTGGSAGPADVAGKPADGTGSDASSGTAGSPSWDLGGTIFVDPAADTGTASTAAAGNGDAASAPRRRGRKPGTRNKSKTETLDLGGVSATLVGIHALLAGMTATPELAIDSEEATQLAAAMDRLAKEYGVAVASRTMAWVNLMMVIGAIYGTRTFAIVNRQRSEKADKAKPVNDDPTVVNFPAGFAGGGRPFP